MVMKTITAFQLSAAGLICAVAECPVFFHFTFFHIYPPVIEYTDFMYKVIE